MNKLTFIGNIKDEQSKASIIKEIFFVSCRMQLDIVNGFLTVENIDDTQINMIIDLIDNYYNINEIIIDNLIDHISNDIITSVPIEEETQIIAITEKNNSYDANSIVQAIGTPIPANKNTKTSVISKEESALLELFSDAFSKLTPDKSIKKQIDVFFTDIGMSTKLKLMKEAFLISFEIYNINFDSIVMALKKSHPNTKKSVIRTSLKVNFKNWLSKYPRLLEVSSNFSLISLIEAFVKRIE